MAAKFHHKPSRMPAGNHCTNPATKYPQNRNSTNIPEPVAHRSGNQNTHTHKKTVWLRHPWGFWSSPLMPAEGQHLLDRPGIFKGNRLQAAWVRESTVVMKLQRLRKEHVNRWVLQAPMLCNKPGDRLQGFKVIVDAFNASYNNWFAFTLLEASSERRPFLRARAEKFVSVPDNMKL